MSDEHYNDLKYELELKNAEIDELNMVVEEKMKRLIN